MRVKGLLTLGGATMALALLTGPGVAWAQDEGTSGASPPVQADSQVAPQPDPSTTTDPVAAPEVAAPSAAPSTDASPATTDSTATDPATASAVAPAGDTTVASSDSVDTTAAQPQAQVETVSSNVTTDVQPKSGGHSCRLARAAAGNGVGPICAGGNRTGRGQISQDPSNPTPLAPIDGVTVGIWISTQPDGTEVVNWRILSGTFGGTDAIDLKVKGAPGEVACQVTNAAPTGTCPAPLNTNSGKAHVAFVDECPGSTTNPPVNPPAGGGGVNGGSGGVAGAVGKGGKKGGKGKGKGGKGGGGGGGSVAGAAVAAVPGEPSGELPVTGFAVLWLLLIGTGLAGGGALMRIRHE